MDVSQDFHFSFSGATVERKDGRLYRLVAPRIADPRRALPADFSYEAKRIPLREEDAGKVLALLSRLDISRYRDPSDDAFELAPPGMHLTDHFVFRQGDVEISWNRDAHLLKRAWRQPLQKIAEELSRIQEVE